MRVPSLCASSRSRRCSCQMVLVRAMARIASRCTSVLRRPHSRIPLRTLPTLPLLSLRSPPSTPPPCLYFPPPRRPFPSSFLLPPPSSLLRPPPCLPDAGAVSLRFIFRFLALRIASRFASSPVSPRFGLTQAALPNPTSNDTLRGLGRGLWILGREFEGGYWCRGRGRGGD
ncbi:uncharacterized protein SCHCODRAFT_02000401 [Schizophyllum commune H4-8]|uniref:uncharacterized protein n=1 Tax=Schizophyllum commune (strain H4-8 / FGSC 9210) TaxID=578458 RepID=UPI00215EA75F|nr:uncharacterized protein SCHCODRAFT_02000401 [Schizophyllum commune H4-8]KAI5899004.1 hypothetical protein SCHCODRAFT_02000401 [Schizophyllum commune H4-8]